MLPDEHFFSYALKGEVDQARIRSELTRMIDSTLATKGAILEKKPNGGLFAPVLMTAGERKKVSG